jgi:hypothetical protein
MVRLLTSADYSKAHVINCAWADTSAQQMMNCAVAAGVMKALPGSSTDAAAAALSSRAAGSSSSSIDSSVKQQHIADIIEVLLLLIRPAVILAGNTKSGEVSSATA